jgi:hypothetical protein
MVTSCVLLSEEKISKEKKKKKVKDFKKTTTIQKLRKKIRAKEEQFLLEHTENANFSYVSV